VGYRLRVPYHHGDLRRALLDTALAAVAEHGPAAVSLRDVARRAGVSHAAPTHHFGDKTGLLTALAAEGWTLLADALTATARRDPRFSELGVAYVMFAVAHPAHFAVMRAPGMTKSSDPELAAAQERASAQLVAGAAAGSAWRATPIPPPRPRRSPRRSRPRPAGRWCTASRRSSWKARSRRSPTSRRSPAP
jgi:AcrR family transcriptional regulator